MDCQKCSGVMSYEGFYGSESGAVWYYPGWRCVHCGEIIDQVVSLNRSLNGGSHIHQNDCGNGKANRAVPHYRKMNGNGYAKKVGKVGRFALKTAGVRDAVAMRGEDEDFMD